MKAPPRVACLVFTVLLVAAGIYAEEIRDDFNRSGDEIGSRWTVESGAFALKNGALESSATGVIGLNGGQIGSAFRLSAQVALASSAKSDWAGIAFNLQDSLHYYALRFNGCGDVHLLKQDGKGHIALVSGTLPSYTPNRPYLLEVASDSPCVFSATVRDAKTGETVWSNQKIADNRRSFTNGRAGLYSNSRARSVYDDFLLDQAAPAALASASPAVRPASAVAFDRTGDGKMFSTYDPSAEEANPKASEFQSPPMQYRPKTWWHWFNGMVSREGVEKDLKAMAEAGLGGAQVFHLGERYDQFHGKIRFGSPEWFDTWRFALETARPLGLELGIHNCDGWSQSGGPWVSPASSMKRLTWTLTEVEGNGTEQTIRLNQPDSVLNYYAEIAVVAYPNRRPKNLAMEQNLERVDLFPQSAFENRWQDLVDGSGATRVQLPLGSQSKPSGFLFCFKQPFKAAGLVVLPGFGIAGKLELAVSDDGKVFRPVKVLDAQPSAQRVDFTPTEARWWRLQAVSASTVQPNNTFPFSKINLEFQEVELLQAGEVSRVMPEVDDLKRKAGLVGGFFSTYRPFLFTRNGQDKFSVSQAEIVRLKPDSNGVVKWTVPEGRWTVMRAGMTTTGKTIEPATDEGKGLEVDKFNAVHVQMHLNAYTKKMIETAGEMSGSVFKVIETDSWEAGLLNWTQGWDEFFRKQNGYDLITFLPVFANQTVDSIETTDRFLFDLRRTYAEALAYNYYDQIKQFCNRCGIRYEAQAQAQHQFIHDAVLSYRHTDIPMTEGAFRGSETINGKEYGISRGAIEAASAAHLFGKQQVSREAFTSIDGNWSHTPFSYKRAADAAFNSGVNLLVFHTFAHQFDETFPGWQMDPWGTTLNRKLTWWPLSKSWFSYLGRAQYMLQQGRSDADILVFYGDGAPGIYDHESYLRKDSLYRGNGRRFDVIDGDSLRNYLTVESGMLKTGSGKAAYKLLVVQKDRYLTPDSLRTLHRLAEAGAQILFEDAGSLPVSNPTLRDRDDRSYQALVKELSGDLSGTKQVISIGKGKIHVGFSEEDVLTALNCPPAFSFTTLSGKGDVNHLRRMFRDGEKIWYFITNHDRREPTEIAAEFRADAVPEIWDPETGKVSDINPLAQSNGMTKLKLQLDPADSLFVVFDRSKQTPPFFKERSVVEQKRLDPPYTVHFDPAWGGPESVVFNALESWTEHAAPGIKNYSGIAGYEKAFTLPDEWTRKDSAVCIEFESIRDVAEIYVNGKLAGSLWKAPFRLDITGYLNPGSNTLLVKVANTWVNRCLYDATLPKEQRLTWANSMQMHFPDETAKDRRFAWKDGPLPSGVIGEVRLVLEKVRMVPPQNKF